MSKLRVDRTFFVIVLILTLAGFLIFISAALGLLAQHRVSFSSIAFNQIFFGLILGSIALFVCSRIHYRTWRKYSLWVFLASAVLTLLVFVPGIGSTHGGARRWIIISGLSFQPSELLKVATIIYFAAWLSGIREKATSLKYGIVPLVVLLSIVGIILLNQPDTDTFVVITIGVFSMYVVAGARFRDILLLCLTVVIAVGILAVFRPYVKARIMTFIHPTHDSQGSGYQIHQSLIAIGSGRVTGRGFGQSIQKFNYLPEPIGDSIFAIAAEEFGLIGSSFIILLFAAFALRGLRISARSPDLFGKLLVAGFIMLIVSQSFINIGAMLGILPLTGIPLVFVSHGGSALFISLATVGIILNVSKHQKRT